MTVDEAREEALKLFSIGECELRSCWECNPAHEHLKEHGLINCFECGKFFYKGIDVTEYDKER